MGKSIELSNFDMFKAVTAHKGHYYATSASNWKVSNDIYDAMHKVREYDKKSVRSGGMAGQTVSVYFVPLPIDAKYEISDYTPDVEGTRFICKSDYSEALEAIAKRRKS